MQIPALWLSIWLSIWLSATTQTAIAREADKNGDIDFGGAMDLSAAAFIPDSGPIVTGAGWLAEGDLWVRPSGFRLSVELDFGGTTGPLFPETLTYLSPERLSVRVGMKDFWFEGGVLPPPWGIESVDPWRNALASWSALRRPGAGSIQGIFGPDGLVPLGTTIGGGFGFGERDWGAMAMAGLDLPAGMNLLGAPLEDIRNSTMIVGGHVYFLDKKFTFSGGAWAHPFDQGPLVIDAGAQFRPKDVWVSVEGAISLQGSYGFMIQGEMLPGSTMSPVLRLETSAYEGPGAALGVNSTPWEFMRLKAEVRYAQQTPSLWAEATIFTPNLGSRAWRPGW